MTIEAMVKELRQLGYRVIAEKHIETFYAEQLIAEDLDVRCAAEPDVRAYIAGCLAHGLGDAIARQLRDKVQIVKSHDKCLHAYKYRTELTLINHL